MNESVLKDVSQYLRAYGWESSQSDDNKILVRFLGERSDTEFHVIIGIDENWIAITIWPYLPPFPPEKRLEAFQSLCQRNFQIKLARFALTDAGETVLCVDLPTKGLTEHLFHLGLDVIYYYADVMYPDLVLLWSKEQS